MKQFKQMVVKGERGQAIVLIALFMVVMLAMVGVAIDGGGLFWLWRNAQNAADSAALQAAFHRCTGASDTIGETWEQVGLAAANINGFDNNGTDNWVIVDDNGGTDYTRVEITAHKPKYFIQLVYRGTLEVKAEALVYCTKAVDFADLPGAVAFGDCNCPFVDPPDYTGGGEDRIDFTGNDADFTGGLHSNCDIRMNPGGAGAYFDDGGPEATGTVDVGGGGLADGSDETEDNVEAAIENPFDYVTIQLYAPSGEIWNNVAIKSSYDDDGGGMDYVDDDNHSGAYNVPDGTEGLLYVDGDVSLKHTDSIGPNGLTIVASGIIEGGRPNDITWQYYGWDGENTGDFGIAGEFPSGQYPSLIAFSMADNRANCAGGVPGSQSAVTVASTNDSDDTFDAIGVIYAPYGWVNWSGSGLDVKGGVYAWSIDFSGSQIKYVFDPSMLPPRAPSMNNVR